MMGQCGNHIARNKAIVQQIECESIFDLYKTGAKLFAIVFGKVIK